MQPGGAAASSPLRGPAEGRSPGHFSHADEDENDPTWSRREAARMRQIMIGKARPEYRRYVVDVPPDQRDPAQPSTPDPRARVSKRQFDRALSEWRRRLHEFDSAPWQFPTAQQGADAGTLGDSQLATSGEAAPQKHTRKQRSARNAQQHSQADMDCGAQHAAPSGPAQDVSGGVVQLRLADQLLGDVVSPATSATQPPWVMTPDPTTPSSHRLRRTQGTRMSDITPDEKTLAPMGCRTVQHPQAPDPRFLPSCWMMNQENLCAQQYNVIAEVPVNGCQSDVDMSLLSHAENNYGHGNVAGHRWPTPTKTAARERPASPHTPPRPRRIFGGPSPPSSAVKTPSRGPWMVETPSPDRMYHAAQRLQPPMEMSAVHMGPPMDMQMCQNGWIGGWPMG